MVGERLFTIGLGIISFLLLIMVWVGALFLSLIFLQYVGAPVVQALVATTGATTTAFFIGALLLLFAEGRRSLRASTSYRRYQQRQHGVSGVLSNYLGILIDSFLCCAILGLWKVTAIFAFVPWMISSVVILGSMIVLDKRRRARDAMW
ncbi:MAG: hypothetical protein DYG89_12440 [Caldilinea sp. CFX5]|nr:hypothetical protein [Caldilinea sp. CFX5]